MGIRGVGLGGEREREREKRGQIEVEDDGDVGGRRGGVWVLAIALRLCYVGHLS
jgi:hypothetical protein